jgi:uncharacterized Zn finger protein
LKNVYPCDAVELYWQETKRYVSLGKLENYQSAVENLIAIRRIMKKNHWQQE